MINKVVTEQVEKTKSFKLPRLRFGKYGGQYTRGILTTLVLVLGLPVMLYLVARPQLLNLVAAPGNTVLSIVPGTKNVADGESGSIEVWINPNGDNVNSAQLVLTYDPAVVNVTGIRPGAFFTNDAATIGQPLEVLKNISTPGKISYAVSLPLSDNVNSSTAVASAAIIDFTAVAQGSSTFSFATTGGEVTKVNDSTGANVFKSGSSGTVMVGGGPRLYLDNISPANPQATGRLFTVDLFMDTAGRSVSGVDASLIFDKNVMKVEKVEQNPVNAFSSFPALEFDNTAGTINISGNIGTSAGATAITGDGISIATVTFTALTQTAGSPISFNYTPGSRNDSNIVEYSASGTEPMDILASVSPVSIITQAVTASPSPTAAASASPTASGGPSPAPSANPTSSASSSPTAAPTAAPTQAPTAAPTQAPTAAPTQAPTAAPTSSPTAAPVSQNMRIIFKAQGRNYPGANKIPNFALSFIRPPLAQVNAIGTLSTNSSGQIITPLAPGNYIFLADAAGFLKRRFGSNSSPVQITAGNLILDLSATPLLGGDFNNDDIINEVDYSLYFLNKFRTNDAVVDLDGSGEVNNLDYGIMRSNWGLRSDTL